MVDIIVVPTLFVDDLSTHLDCILYIRFKHHRSLRDGLTFSKLDHPLKVYGV